MKSFAWFLRWVFQFFFVKQKSDGSSAEEQFEARNCGRKKNKGRLRKERRSKKKKVRYGRARVRTVRPHLKI